jgi:hypothetical protein
MRDDDLDDELLSDFELRALTDADGISARPTDAEDTSAKGAPTMKAQAAPQFEPMQSFVMPPAQQFAPTPASGKGKNGNGKRNGNGNGKTVPQTGPAFVPQTGPAAAKPEPIPMPVQPSTDAATAYQAVTDLTTILRSIPRGTAPRLGRLPTRARSRGLCAIVLVWSDGRKDVLR